MVTIAATSSSRLQPAKYLDGRNRVRNEDMALALGVGVAGKQTERFACQRRRELNFAPNDWRLFFNCFILGQAKPYLQSLFVSLSLSHSISVCLSRQAVCHSVCPVCRLLSSDSRLALLVYSSARLFGCATYI